MTDWTTPETRIVATWIQNDEWTYASSRHAAHHGRLREHISDTLRSGITDYFTIDMLESSLNRVDWEQLWSLFEDEPWYEDADCADCGAVDNAGTVEHALWCRHA